jgi:hypothetical protein
VDNAGRIEVTAFFLKQKGVPVSGANDPDPIAPSLDGHGDHHPPAQPRSASAKHKTKQKTKAGAARSSRSARPRARESNKPGRVGPWVSQITTGPFFPSAPLWKCAIVTGTMLAFAFLQHRRLSTARRGKKNQRTAASTKLAVRPPRHRRTHRSTAAETMPALPKMDWQQKAA